MAQFAVLVNNVAVNTIVAETKELALEIYPGAILEEIPEGFPLNLGFVFDGTKFTDPNATPDTTPRVK
jgi:hypothetical protein